MFIAQSPMSIRCHTHYYIHSHTTRIKVSTTKFQGNAVSQGVTITLKTASSANFCHFSQFCSHSNMHFFQSPMVLKYQTITLKSSPLKIKAIYMVFKKTLQTPIICQWPYRIERTSDQTITQVKQRRATSVLGWVTALEHWMLLASLSYIQALSAQPLKNVFCSFST